MAPTTPTGVPGELVAGDSWRWRIADLSDYPQSEGWALKYRLVGVDVLSITPTYQTSGNDALHWLISVASTETASLVAAGRYRLIGRVEGSGDYDGRVETVSDDIVRVNANPQTADAGDFQTHSEKMRLALEAAVEGMISTDHLIEQYGVAGRTVSKMPHEQRVRLLAQYRWADHHERTGRLGRPVGVRFG